MLRNLELSKRSRHVLLEGKRCLVCCVCVSDDIELSIVLDIIENLCEDIRVGGKVGTVDAPLNKRKVLSRSDEVAE